jgi:lipoprotein-anchoring transpeptidase ErfK/SrfK
MRAIVLAAATLALVACSAQKRHAASQPAQHRCAAGTTARVGDDRFAYAATARRRLRAYRLPGRRPFASFGRLNVNGVPTVFGVLAAAKGSGCAPTWYRVQLPMRPNGATGWVRADTVDLTRTDARVVVDRSARRLYLYRGGKRVLVTPAAVGSRATPTPLGRFYVNQRFLSDPRGPFGPAAIGISAFSPVLIHWAQGGPVAIHGTNAPWSIGRPVSNGCIRVPNPVIRKLWRTVPAGTPVLIRA